MRYNVAQLLKEASGATRYYQLDVDIGGLDPLLVPVEHLMGEIAMLRTGTGVLVTGHLVTRVELVCSRCLTPFEAPLAIDVEEEFRPTVDVITGRHLVMEEEDEALWIDDHHVLDLTEVVRQDLLLALPLHPLCKEDCAGLCPVCGHNLNEGPCGCTTGDVDLRWAALLDLKLK
ncbi:MAG: DUF177 domain-containing protein [Anaerolineae bacterium]|nr:DUF177 domain-containing protein [Anaerolineae bacterium]